MLHRIFVISCLSSILLLAACSSEPPVDTVAEAQVIREVSREWSAAFAVKDLDAIMSYYAPDALQMPANSPSIQGKEAIRAWYELWLPNPDVTSTFAPDVIEVAVSGDLAYDRGTYHFKLDTPDGTVEDRGTYLIVWKKIDGEWKTLADMSNSDGGS
ncbi:MAG: SgcJ/EcaC family oxidoreductase [bacterium]|nr:SgcJ/EcaC family oxidoreductase [bacterium]